MRMWLILTYLNETIDSHSGVLGLLVTVLLVGITGIVHVV